MEKISNVKLFTICRNFAIIVYMINIGIDIGSTTVKVVAIKDNKIIYNSYLRHSARVLETILDMLKDLYQQIGDQQVSLAIAGSAGLGVSSRTKLPFVQEVIAASTAIKKSGKNVDCVIELGGEDAKIIFFGQHLEQRMNGTCAGGTGAFIDQMATLLGVDVLELNELAKKHKQLYTIASRCGVFAKSDIQPLLNQGATKEDLAASIFQAIVSQTIIGLAQGRKIAGNIAFLGGPLYFFSELRNAFIKTLKLSEEQVIFPNNAHLFVAIGAAYESEKFAQMSLSSLIDIIANSGQGLVAKSTVQPLFTSQEDFDKFVNRHTKESKQIHLTALEGYQGDAYLGIDAGSTTTKIVLLGANQELLFQFYDSNKGQPLYIIRDQLINLLTLCKKHNIRIVSSAVTGYGEELMQKAFFIDFGFVETVAHFEAARFFDPEVTFIIDIGGQDMKCMRIKNNAIDSIMLNEACSSGCGSFIESFAKALGYNSESFSRLGLFASHPADLGSRCTVFMNSSVKQAQKDGATVPDVAAGIAISVIKNALYKVLRIKDSKELGDHIVVQGGTFYNDAVLRALEKEIGAEVTRPNIAGLMGAFGAALLAQKNAVKAQGKLNLEVLNDFHVSQRNTNCNLCANKCLITISTFEDKRSYISGNKCERPLGKAVGTIPNAFLKNLQMLLDLKGKPGKRGKIGLPLVLNLYDNLPFWMSYFTALDFEVVVSGTSNGEIYHKGQDTIPSDTACYPAKLVHGHIIKLINDGIKNIFHPIIVYNVKEKDYVDNHYNCPVVAYYPELINGNVDVVKSVNYITPYIELMSPNFNKMMLQALQKAFPDITMSEVKSAAKKAWRDYRKFQEAIREEGQKAIEYAEQHKLPLIILAGRPYHLDPGINHGIAQLLTTLNTVVIAENQISHLGFSGKIKVLNQWSFHSRLYDAAQYACNKDNAHLVQLVSFGCGLDAVTTDETRRILESHGKLYTQIKIDEISNLGAAKIRLRSLLAAIDNQKEEKADGKVSIR